MVSIFRKHRTGSVPTPQTERDVIGDVDRRFSAGSSSVDGSGFDLEFSEHAIDDSVPVIRRDEYSLSPASSRALSENETLNDRVSQKIELQSTYVDNFDHYLPFVLRRHRLAQSRTNSTVEVPPSPIVPHDFDGDSDDDDDDDDLSTILAESASDLVPEINNSHIMGKDLGSYNLKRELVIVNEFIKHNTFIFASRESFETFKFLKSKKSRKDSMTLESDNDSRNHIIPLQYKRKGIGLPLLKLTVPYMSSLRKGTPLIVFHKYLETDLPPGNYDHGNVGDDDFETYKFCEVYSKRSQESRRYRFEFTLGNGEKKTILAFQNNFKPFADFNYKGTRFRILGTAVISTSALSYNPSLKLLIIDNDKPSLCDDLINKKPGFEISSIIKKLLKSKPLDDDELKKLKPEEYPNPHPNPDNLLLQDETYLNINDGISNVRDYIPNNLPPFGIINDFTVPQESSSLIPKKYSEVGQIEVYQDNKANTITQQPRRHGEIDVNSTKSVDIDNLILSCILSTFREIDIRSSARPGTTTVVHTKHGPQLTVTGDTNWFAINE